MKSQTSPAHKVCLTKPQKNADALSFLAQNALEFFETVQ